MELTSVGESNLEYFLPFLGDDVKPEWGIIGAVEDDSAIGAIAFEVSDDIAIMKSIFVDENYRRRGVASELLDEAKRAFFDEGIFNFVVYYDENEGLTAFLEDEGFVCAQSDPVYSYPIDRAMASKKVMRLQEMGISKNVISYGELQIDIKQKAYGFLEQNGINNSMLSSGSYDDKLSFAYVKDGNIKGVLLAREEEPDIYLNLLLTDETDSNIASYLLSAFANAIREQMLFGGQLIMAVSNDKLRKSLETLFDEHLDVRTYTWSALLQV